LFARLIVAGMAATVLMSVAVVPTSSDAQTLREELAVVLASHPRLKAEKSRAAAAKAEVQRAFAGFLPTLALTGDVGPEYIDSPARTSSTQLTRRKTTLTLTQNIFDGYRTPERHKSAVLRETVARQRVDATRQSLILEGIAAYYDILRQSRMIAIARTNENAVRIQLQLEDERVRRGGGIAVDALLAKTRLQLARERTVQLRGGLAEAHARYRQIFGHVANPSRMINPKLALGALPDDIDSAAAASVSTNPSLLASKSEAEIAGRSVEVARSGYFPKVDLVALANRENDVDSVKGVRREWSIVLKATWELFSGFRTTAGVAAAAREKAAAMDTYQFNRRKVDEELRITWEQLQTARERVKLLSNAAVIAEEVYEARKRLRDSGKETAINVLDAQTELFSAQMNAISAEFDAEVASFRVLFAMGMLTPEVLGL
jgi:outer membrane protein, adhesin transport system